MRLVRGVVQHYPWGHQSVIPQLLGLPADGRPWAELWFGTHLGGPGKVFEVDDESAVIDGDALALDPDGALRTLPRRRTAEDDSGGISVPLVSVSGELPYLVKVLAAAQPLSLQSHPSEQQARNGYARENRLGIPVSNSRRIYRDPFAKPELVCALGRFEALCGFRDPADTVPLLHDIGGGASVIARHLTDYGLARTVQFLFSGGDDIRLLLHDVIAACESHDSASASWAARLAGSYPDDPAVAVTLLMNHVVLTPGQALFLGPGNLHAYLSGMGVEVMGSSDNVVRCGLTNKHVDVNELLATVDPVVLPDPVLKAVPLARTAAGKLWRFETPPAPFVLSVHQIDGRENLRATTRELVLCGIGSTDRLRRGEVAYLAPGEELVLDGKATLFRVSEPTTNVGEPTDNEPLDVDA